MEQASGSIRFSEEYEKNERKLNRIATKKINFNQDLRLIMKDRKKANQLVKDIEKSGRLIEKEVQLETQVFSSRFLVLYLDAITMKKKVKKFKEEVKKKGKEIERISGLILKNSVEGKDGMDNVLSANS